MLSAVGEWRHKARELNNDIVDRMVDAIHMVVDMRANGREEDSLALALAERVELMKVLMTMTFDGVLED